MMDHRPGSGDGLHQVGETATHVWPDDLARVGAGVPGRKKILFGNREVIVPEQPQPLEHRRLGMQRRVVPDDDIQAFVISLAGLPAKLVLRLAIGLAVTLEFLADHPAICIDKFRPLIEKLLGCWNITIPNQRWHRFNLRIGPGNRVLGHCIFRAEAKSHLAKKIPFHEVIMHQTKGPAQLANCQAIIPDMTL